MPSRSSRAPAVSENELAGWCTEYLGSAPEATLFEAGYLSQVTGFRLVDGREVVVKVRDSHPRLIGCHAVHSSLWRAGYPCSEPLVGPVALGGFAASAEARLAGGAPAPRAIASPHRFARALAQLVALAPGVDDVPSLDPSPPWAAWDHEEPGLWPSPDDRDTDLNRVEANWIDEAAERVRRRLSEFSAPRVVGHGDWYSANIWWADDDLYAVHDWDSVVAQPEAVIAGLAAAVFPATGAPGEAATIAESEDFIAAYGDARGKPWTADEREAAWAAGLWVRSFDAKKEFSSGKALGLSEEEAADRLHRAGA